MADADLSLSTSSLAESIGVGEKELDAIYALAYSEFDRGQLSEAEKTFGTLCQLDHTAERAWLGLGAVREKQQNFGGAILAYSMLPAIGSANPAGPLRAAACYLAISELDAAAEALSNAVDLAENSPNPAQVLARVELLSAAIRQQLAG